MNFRLLSKLLGILTFLIGCFMLFSLIWADPGIGAHTDPIVKTDRPETDGIRGLIYSAIICWVLGGLMFRYGRGGESKIYRKEAMAVVGLSWVLATVLGAMPYIFSGTHRGPSVRVIDDSPPTVLVAASRWKFWVDWEQADSVSTDELKVIRAVSEETARGLTERELIERTEMDHAPQVFLELEERWPWKKWLASPGHDPTAPADRASNFRLNWVRMGLIDSLFESQSGFSTTGATVICDLEDPHLVPHCILFWRASTQFLGGLGIIVLFVVLLGQGSAGKALMRAEMPGPTHESSSARMQHTAWLFAAMYVGLNFVLAVILTFLGMSVFDAVCHSFATMATGGFSTYNASLGHFFAADHGRAIEYVVIVFMILAGANFSLLFLVLIGNPLQLIKDIEFRTYVMIIALATATILLFGMRAGDGDFFPLEKGFRNGLFQVVSILTTTGYGTADFDNWNNFGRGLLLMLMFVGGCAGSTGGGMKVIRHILFAKILRMEIEGSFQPKEVRLLKLGGKATDDQTLRHSIMVYFGLIGMLFVFGFLFVLMIEPNVTWGSDPSNKLIDSASAVASTLNNIGPGLGVVGSTQNYSNFSFLTKSLFIWLMMLGRLEIFPILVLFAPRFWRDQ